MVILHIESSSDFDRHLHFLDCLYNIGHHQNQNQKKYILYTVHHSSLFMLVASNKNIINLKLEKVNTVKPRVTFFLIDLKIFDH